MLGGVGKYLGILLASILIPIYAGLIYGLLNIQYLYWSLAAGLVAMMLLLMAVLTIKNSLFQGYRALGLTTQRRGGKDTFNPLVFKEYLDLGKDDNYFRYAFRDRNGNITLGFVDDPIEKLVYESDEVIADPWVQTMPVNYPTGVEIGSITRHIPLCDRQEPGFFARHLFHEEVETTEHIPIVYLYATNMTAEKILNKTWKLSDINPPSTEALRKIQQDFELIDTQETRTRLAKAEETIEDLERMIEDKVPLWVRVKPTVIEEEGKIDWSWLKWVLLFGGIAVVVILAVYWYLGIIPGWSFPRPVNATAVSATAPG